MAIARDNPSVAGDCQIAIGSRAGTPALQRNMSSSGDLDLQRYGPDRQIRPYRLQPPCRWRSPDRHSAGSGDPALQREARGGQAPALRSPGFNMANARGTGPRAPGLFRLLHLPKRRQRTMRRRHRAPQPTHQQRLTLTTKRHLLNLIVMLNPRLR